MTEVFATYKDIDSSILIGLPNPAKEAYEIKIKVPEFTFLGMKQQPDFATIFLTMYPNEKIIELRSLKNYVYQLRSIVISYERLINVVYDHLYTTYKPARLRLVMNFNPRGGISSKLTIDSDWKIRGGADIYSKWNEHDNSWINEYDSSWINV
ncbi:NADPH-dependent 7-cyano-7-deazaguanine reductase [Legionella lansingensis]|uniref:NADPH-dependent 7-cyano-7-deazaguanine reductase n=1 Tax=Legionella lansingensis TaxID=45067 RepID=A0A0W0V741_9GAMM|nr:7-cyano-7-deazaguanine reductase [Legionella lansingensis]KTD15936.1 NADPH-dependent 7-cyano-7-deazaguanine reductase [Legionella lansingensis]SNV48100.1 NADPH-dependent 7-cyano-7-deazaguanine reductase [Legionella lansingensis]